MAKIAVTGANGFLGRHLVPFLQGLKHDVYPITRDKYDLLERDDTFKAVKTMDWVIHLAADMGGVGYFTYHDYYPFLQNMQMDLNVLTMCESAGVKRLLYASSACVYPTFLQKDATQVSILREELLEGPQMADQMYGWEKLMGLKLCERAPFDARVAILNTVYGPDCDTEGERVKAPAAIALKCLTAKKTGEKINIWGDGRQIRQFLYITDAIEMLYRVLQSDKYDGPVNITADDPKRLIEYYDLCTNILKFDTEFELQPEKPTGVVSRVVSGEKFRKLYNYSPKVNYQEGFTSLINWVQAKSQ